MKKFVKGLLLLAALIIAVALAVTYFPGAFSSPSDDTTTSGTANSTDDSDTAGPPQKSETLARPDDATRSVVAYVHDGDTLFLQPEGTHGRDDQIKVRLIGLDTPEINPEVECFGVEARDYLRSLVPEGTDVWVMPGREEFDQFGRSLLYVWTTDDLWVNLDLVEKGFATALNIPPSNSYWQQFDAAEAVARNAGAGLWGSC